MSLADFQRWTPIPADVTRVDGCTCGGSTFHRVRSDYDPPGSGCAIWSLPNLQAMAAVTAAEDRLAEYTAGLNARLRRGLSPYGETGEGPR